MSAKGISTIVSVFVFIVFAFGLVSIANLAFGADNQPHSALDRGYKHGSHCIDGRQF